MKISFSPVNVNRANQNKGLPKQPTMHSEQRPQTSFADSKGIYGRVIAFGNIMMKVNDFQNIKTSLANFVETECKPFIQETKEFADKNQQMHNTADKITSSFYRKVICGKTDFNIFELGSVKEGFSRPIEYFNNIKEYQYLKEKSKSIFSNDEAIKYANEIEPLFTPTPYLEHFSPVMTILKRIEKTIKNGFAGLETKKKVSAMQQKRNNVHEAKTLSLYNQYYISNVRLFCHNVKKVFAKPEDAYFATKILKYNEQVPEIKNSIKNHKELLTELNEGTQNAEKLLSENKFTEEDIDKALQAVELKKQGIIKRNMQEFNEALDRQKSYKWDNSKNAETEELLQKQSEANGKLWNMIEESKKEFFRPRTDKEMAKADIEAKAAIAQEMKRLGITNEDDLPF